jgi:hypothetical protein
VFDVIGGDIGKRSADLVRAGGTLVTIVGPAEARPADGLVVDFVVESDRAQLSEIVQRVRHGRLRTNLGEVSTLADAVAAFNPTKRRTGKTIIRICLRPLGKQPSAGRTTTPSSGSPKFGRCERHRHPCRQPEPAIQWQFSRRIPSSGHTAIKRLTDGEPDAFHCPQPCYRLFSHDFGLRRDARAGALQVWVATLHQSASRSEPAEAQHDSPAGPAARKRGLHILRQLR